MTDFGKEPEDLLKQQFKRIENITNSRFDNLLEQIESLSINIQKVYEIENALDAALIETNKVLTVVANELTNVINDNEIIKKYLITKDPSIYKLLYPKTVTKNKKIVKKKRTTKK